MLKKEFIEDIYPLTPLQEGFYYQFLYDKSSSAYLEQIAYRVTGQVSVPTLEESLNALLRRHPALRTVFNHEKVGRPLQVVLKERRIPFHYVDLRHVPGGPGRERCVQEAKDRDRATPFDLNKDVLMRFTVLQLADQEYAFIWSHHHILMDGWCLSILTKEFFEIYNSLLQRRACRLAPAEPFRTYIKWLDQQDKAKQKQYWLTYLSGYTAREDIPRRGTEAAGIQPGRPAELAFEIGEENKKNLVKLASRYCVTLGTVLHAAWGILLTKYGNRRDAVFGSVVSGRPGGITGIESMVGMFINTVPVRVRYDPGDRVEELLRQVHRNAVESEPYHYAPLFEIQGGNAPGRALINHILVLENYPVADQVDRLQNDLAGEAPGFRITGTEAREETTFDFSLVIGTSKNLPARMLYNASVYDPSCVAGIARHLKAVIAQMLENPQATVARLELLSPAEKRQVLVEFNDTRTDYPRDQTIHALFEAQAAATPEATAVVFEGTRLTYRALNEEANQLAHRLQQHYRVQPDEVVGVMLAPSEKLVPVLLGILKAGAAYVALDASLPADRIAYMAGASGVRVVIARDAGGPAPEGTSRLALREEEPDLSRSPRTNPAAAAGARHLAYLIGTSGSTGRPKLVAIEHRGVVRLVKNQPCLGLSRSTRVLSSSRLSFDGSTYEIWGPLLNGGEVHLLPAAKSLDAGALKAYLSECAINTMWFTASWCNFLVEADLDIFAPLTYVVVGGEKLSAKHINRLREAHPGLTVLNGYGPTENTTFSTCFPVREPHAHAIPIGKPIANSAVYILDQDQHPVPAGVVGELYLAGDGLARGYLDAEETARKFTWKSFFPGQPVRLYRSGDLGKWLPDGNIAFVGRNDDQVKVRGYRIEPAGIEHVLAAHPLVRTAVVSAVATSETASELVAYVTLQPGDPQATVTELKAHLARSLPAYMVPAVFVPVASFALNANGKIDRHALPHPGEGVLAPAGPVEPRSPAEARIADIWSRILEREKIGVLDNFFELGGHSLKAAQVVVRIAKELDVKVELKDFFLNPTVEGLARAVAAAGPGTGENIEPLPPQPGYDLSPAQKRIWVTDQMEKGLLAYNMPVVYTLRGALDVPALTRAFHQLVGRHEVLRTSFVTLDGVPRQCVADADRSGFEVVYRDLRALDDRAEVASAWADREANTAFALDSSPLIRVTLLQLEDNEYVLVCILHHIIADGWSLHVMMRDITCLYHANRKGLPGPLADLRIQYKDFAAWQNQQIGAGKLEALHQYWRKQLRPAGPSLRLPYDNPDGDKRGFRGKSIGFTLEAFGPALRGLSRERGTTLFSTLLATVKSFLYQFSDEADLTVGTTVAERPHKDLEDQIGLYLNVLLLRTRFSEDFSFRELHAAVHDNALMAYAHALYPFDVLLESGQARSGASPLPFDVFVHLNNTKVVLGEAGPGEPAEPELAISPFRVDFNQSRFPLSFLFHEGDAGIRCTMTYNSDLFTAASARRISEGYLFALRTILENPGVPVKSLREACAGHWESAGKENRKRQKEAILKQLLNA
ncbi:MAG: amino acid adenylation domain-containing protein [Cytophagales bacterium]|nr:amino acid adenylation domain-containing protein [Cytophagales bacterium]